MNYEHLYAILLVYKMRLMKAIEFVYLMGSGGLSSSTSPEAAVGRRQAAGGEIMEIIRRAAQERG